MQSIIGVATAVPAFIGYTENEVKGPRQINSLADYEAYFGAGPSPSYRIDPAPSGSEGDFKAGETSYVLAAVTPAYNLYSSVQFFYANGGASAYVVSAGTYGQPVDADALVAAIGALSAPAQPTLLVVPDAVSLPPDDANVPYVSAAFTKVARAMLAQCALLQDRFAIIDVYGGGSITKTNLGLVLRAFSAAIPPGTTWGAGYLPFLFTTIVPETITYANIDAGSAPLLNTLLTGEANRSYTGTALNDALALLGRLAIPPPPGQTRDVVLKLNQALIASFPLLGSIVNAIATRTGVLPPSGAIAGVYTQNDANRGVWTAPANIALEMVTWPAYNVSKSEEHDPVAAGANAIRMFAGQGSLVWGARTLDPQNGDYRYIQVRRTIIYIEQSIKLALGQYVFAANDATTWSAIVAMCSSFLTSLWESGGLAGPTPRDAFNVQCGLGTTMSADDILNGMLYVQVEVAILHPAEFVVVTIGQTMPG